MPHVFLQIKEKRVEALDPDHGGGTITVTSTYESQNLSLWSHPLDDCCPLVSVELPEVGVGRLFLGFIQCCSAYSLAHLGDSISSKPGWLWVLTSSSTDLNPHSQVPPNLDVYRLLLAGQAVAQAVQPVITTSDGTPSAPASNIVGPGGVVPMLEPPPVQPLMEDEPLQALWASLPRGRNVLRPLAIKRCLAKACCPKAVSYPVVENEGTENERTVSKVDKVPEVLRRKLMLEGVQVGLGLADPSCLLPAGRGCYVGSGHGAGLVHDGAGVHALNVQRPRLINHYFKHLRRACGSWEPAGRLGASWGHAH